MLAAISLLAPRQGRSIPLMADFLIVWQVAAALILCEGHLIRWNDLDLK